MLVCVSTTSITFSRAARLECCLQTTILAKNPVLVDGFVFRCDKVFSFHPI
jgi:hypothetical protein